MKTDANKNITNIQYNFLNLPTQVTINGQNITYVYDATGTKLRKTVNGVTTDYAGNFIYENDVLQFFNQPEGYVEPSGSNFNYVYQYKDHLGNIRLSYQDKNNDGVITASTEIVEENNYYPFGLEHKGYNNVVTSTNPAQNYKYNGKELQDELGLNMYDYGARMYDPAKGRWDVTDGKSELYFSSSPYVYASNTPVQAVDPDGNLVIFINGMHTGDGGKADYWRTYETVRYMTGTKSFMGFSYHTYSTYRRETAAFDRSVMNQLGDQRAMYKDGATGGALGIITSYGMIGSNTSAQNRIDAGYANGKKDAKVIIENLARDKTTGEIVETIKIITHSMGGAYGKGYVKALKEYIKTLPKEMQYQVKISMVVDYDPYQAGSLTADGEIPTWQKMHKGFWNIFGLGWLANENENGKVETTTNTDSSTDHSIMSFMSDIKNLSEGTYKWDASKQQWVKQ